MEKVSRRFLKAWEEATGGPIIKLPCGCYLGPCPSCGNHSLVVGVDSNPCGGPESHEADVMPEEHPFVLH